MLQAIKGEGGETQLTSIRTRNHFCRQLEGNTPRMARLKIFDNPPIPFISILGILGCRVSPQQELSCSATCADDTPAP